MSESAFLFMLVSWGLILGLDIFCFTLLLTREEPPATGRRNPPDLEEEIT